MVSSRAKTVAWGGPPGGRHLASPHPVGMVVLAEAGGPDCEDRPSMKVVLRAALYQYASAEAS